MAHLSVKIIPLQAHSCYAGRSPTDFLMSSPVKRIVKRKSDHTMTNEDRCQVHYDISPIAKNGTILEIFQRQ